MQCKTIAASGNHPRRCATLSRRTASFTAAPDRASWAIPVSGGSDLATQVAVVVWPWPATYAIGRTLVVCSEKSYLLDRVCELDARRG